MNITFGGKFHRCIIFSNIPISGYYRFEDIFQINRGNIHWPQHRIGMMSQLPIVLEINSNFYKDYITISSNREYDEERFRHKDFQKELIALLSLIGNANFYEDKSYSLTNEELGKNYCEDSFFTVDELGQNLEINDESIYKIENNFLDTVKFPETREQFFSNYFSLKNEYLNKFRMSLMLYYNSIKIKEYSPSMSYIALVSAIENLADLENKMNNNHIENAPHQPTKKFVEFMKKYTGNKTKKYKKYYSDVYDKRSNISHLGELFYNDYADTELDHNGRIELNNLKLFVRVALYNWLLNQKKHVK